VCVVLASGGYPGRYEKDLRIDGLDAAAQVPDVQIFHAGARLDGETVRTDGGRILSVTALGADLAAARDRAYEAMGKISVPNAFYRRDIGIKALTKAPSRGAE
jgi:phosphoribosylamine--glycine ligase